MPRFIPSWIAAALCLAGAAACIQLVQTPGFCGFGGCDVTLSSRWATIPIPSGFGQESAEVSVAVLGLGYFTVLLTWFVLIGLPRAERRGWSRIPLVLVTIGLCVSAVFMGLMALGVEAWCGRCLAVHGINTLLAGLVWLRPSLRTSRTEPLEETGAHALTTLGCGLALAGGLGLTAVRGAISVATVRPAFQEPVSEDSPRPSLRGQKGDRSLAVLPGQPVAIFGRTLDGQQLDSRNPAGVATLVVYWSSRCGHCRQEAARVEAIHQSLSKERLRVIGVNLDRSPAEAQRFIEQHNLTWPQISAASDPAVWATVSKLRITSVPRLLLIAGDGRLVRTGGSLDQLGNEISDETPESESLASRQP